MPVNVIGTIKPKNNGKFPVAEAVDIKVTDNLRLDKALENKADLSTVNFALGGKADNSDIDNLQAQINEIITPVTQDAEVQNARVGADGTSYNTLKERIDTENAAINGQIDKLEENIGVEWATATGTIELTTFYSRTAPNTPQTNTNYNSLTVDIGNNSQAKITCGLPSGATNISACLFLDSTYNLINHIGDGDNTEVVFEDELVTIPANTKYIRLVSKNSYAICAVKLKDYSNTRFDTLSSEINDISSEIATIQGNIDDIVGKTITTAIDLTSSENVITGEYIVYNSSLVQNSGFSRTKPIHLAKNSKIIANVKAYVGTSVNTVAIFARYNSSEDTYTVIQIATTADQYEYSYTAVEDMDIVVSFRNYAGNELSIEIHESGELDKYNSLISNEAIWVCFGDSITGKYTTKSIPEMMSELYGCTVYNCGFPGTRASTRDTTDYQYFDFDALADAVVSGDYTDQEEHLSGVVPIFSTRLNTLESIDFTKVTNAYFFYGTNDFNGSKSISYTCNGLISGITKILTAYPNITPVVITPMFRFKVENNEVIFMDEWTNGADKTLVDYAEGIVEAAKDNYIPVINLYEKLGITKQNYTKYFDISDGTHPSETGIQYVGKSIAKMLDYLNPPAIEVTS